MSQFNLKKKKTTNYFKFPLSVPDAVKEALIDVFMFQCTLKR